MTPPALLRALAAAALPFIVIRIVILITMNGGTPSQGLPSNLKRCILVALGFSPVANLTLSADSAKTPHPAAAIDASAI